LIRFGATGTYAVLGKRRARVMREELREGSNLFSILAFLPAQASFGLADDLRRRTSGGASAALMLSHWERLQVLSCCPTLLEYRVLSQKL
jgi:ribosome assembly protein 1